MEVKTIQEAIEQTVDDAVRQPLFIQDVILSLILVVSLGVIRFLLVKVIRGKAEVINNEQRRWINRTNNLISFIILIAIFFIWAPQLQTFALSLTAIAVAVVLSTKELLMCLTGGFLRVWSKPFDIGDWITVDGVTGEVMEITAMIVKIEEIDVEGQSYQYTGETIQIPNSKFLSANIKNAEFLKNYIYHEVPITVQYVNLDPSMLMLELNTIVEKYFSPLREQATNFNRNIEKKTAVDFGSVEPEFYLKTTVQGHYLFSTILFIPTKEANSIGSQITRDFLSLVYLENSKKISEKHDI